MNKSDLIIKKHVAEFREKAGLSQTEPIKIEPLLHKLKVLAVFKPLSENFSGMALKSNNYQFILINSNQPIGRQNFTIGHEMYHLFVEENHVPHKCQSASFDKSSKNEYIADLFSVNLLMPEEGILMRIPEAELAKDKIKIGTILELEQTFGVSHQAFLYRLKSFGIVSQSFVDENKNDIIRTASRNGFDTTIYKPGNEGRVIGDYKVLANELFSSDKISEGHLNELISAYQYGEEEA
jgi:Zn-dependent peptidase ImmA (M78 family)